MDPFYTNPHTDLALEARESFPGDNVEIPGVIIKEHPGRHSRAHITSVFIETAAGAQAMNKPIGSYITMELPAVWDQSENEEYSQELSLLIRSLLPKHCRRILVTGLGNRNMTADALGPFTVERLTTGRLSDQGGISAVIPGVMSQTGLETASIIKGIVSETRPDVVIAIDALCARRISRLSTTIQLTDTGILPGSGVGNHRLGLTRDTIGVPVIAIGIPMVVGATTIAYDTLEALLDLFSEALPKDSFAGELRHLSEDEKRGLLQQLAEPNFGPMYVMPKEADETVVRLSELLACGIQHSLPSGNSNDQ